MTLLQMIFGLDKQLLLKLKKDEILRYKSLLFLFLLLVSFSLIGGAYLGFIVTSKYPVAIISGLFISFTFFNVLRFSLTSVDRNYSNKINSLLSFSLFIKLFLLLCIGSLFAFPLASLVQRPYAQKTINEYKKEALKKYDSDQQERLNTELRIFEVKEIKLLNSKESLLNKIDSLELNLQQQELGTSIYKDCELELIILNNDLNSLNEELMDLLERKNIALISKKKLLEKRKKSFVSKINKNEQAIFQLQNISTNKIGSSVILIIYSLITILIVQYTKLTYSNNFLYGKLSHELFRQIIQANYLKTKQSCAVLLEKKYGYIENSKDAYLDPPFNSIKIESNQINCVYSNFEEFINLEIKN